MISKIQGGHRGVNNMTIKANRTFRPQAFFKKTPLACLLEFFTQVKPDFSEILDLENNNLTDTDCLQKEFTLLPLEYQNDLALINDISTPEGMPYLLEICKKYDLNIDCNTMTPEILAYKIYQANKKAFYEAFTWYDLDLVNNYKYYRGKHPKEPNVKNYDMFSSILAEVLKNQARGEKVKLEYFDESNKIAYVINYGEYFRSYTLLRGDFITLKDRPAREIRLVYSPELAQLRISAPYNNLEKTIKDLFAKYVLEDENFFEGSEKIEFFDLSKIFKLTQDYIKSCLFPSDNILKVEITKIKAQVSSNKKAVFEFKSPEELIQTIYESGLKVEYLKVISVKFKFTFLQNEKQINKYVELTLPNRNSLGDSPKENVIKKYLKKWEIISE